MCRLRSTDPSGEIGAHLHFRELCSKSSGCSRKTRRFGCYGNQGRKGFWEVFRRKGPWTQSAMELFGCIGSPDVTVRGDQ